MHLRKQQETEKFRITVNHKTNLLSSCGIFFVGNFCPQTWLPANNFPPSNGEIWFSLILNIQKRSGLNLCSCQQAGRNSIYWSKLWSSDPDLYCLKVGGYLDLGVCVWVSCLIRSYTPVSWRQRWVAESILLTVRGKGRKLNNRRKAKKKLEYTILPYYKH